MITARLELRRIPAAAAHALPGDREAAAQMLGAELPAEWPLPDLLDVLPSQAAGRERFGAWVMIERENGIVVGDVGFLGPPGGDGVVEIGYSVVPDRRGRGYAAEAARAMAKWALAQDGVRAVAAGCAPDNAASIRTLERAGFRQTGTAAGGEIRWIRS